LILCIVKRGGGRILNHLVGGEKGGKEAEKLKGLVFKIEARLFFKKM